MEEKKRCRVRGKQGGPEGKGSIAGEEASYLCMLKRLLFLKIPGREGVAFKRGRSKNLEKQERGRGNSKVDQGYSVVRREKRSREENLQKEEKTTEPKGGSRGRERGKNA